MCQYEINNTNIRKQPLIVVQGQGMEIDCTEAPHNMPGPDPCINLPHWSPGCEDLSNQWLSIRRISHRCTA